MAIRGVWLASASLRRGQWLQSLLTRVAPEVRLSQMALMEDEVSHPHPTVREIVKEVTETKLLNAISELTLGRINHLDWNKDTLEPAEVVTVVSDTLVADPDALGIPLGKPVDEFQAAAMLSRLSGRRHKVWSATGIITSHSAIPADWRVEFSHAEWRGAIWIESATVEFSELEEDVMNQLISSGSWMGKAGAYDLAGSMGAHAVLIDGAEVCVLGMAGAAMSALENLIAR